jgi:hypothetical protein
MIQQKLNNLKENDCILPLEFEANSRNAPQLHNALEEATTFSFPILSLHLRIESRYYRYTIIPSTFGSVGSTTAQAWIPKVRK